MGWIYLDYSSSNIKHSRTHGGYGCGTQTAAIAFGGYVFSPPAPALGATNATQLYDGTSWTAAGNINTGRHSLAGSVAGSQTAASAFGGGNTPSPTGATELYDGSTWSSDTNLSTARELFRRCWYTNGWISFWWYFT
jgi:hypothetical protein